MNSTTDRVGKNLSTASSEELRSYLITCDYKGKEFKEKVLDELLSRAVMAGKNLQC